MDAPIPTTAPDSGRNTATLTALYRAHAAQVARWARKLLPAEIDPEDVVHDVFLVAWRRLDDFRGDAQHSTWLYAITRRVASAHRRRQRRFAARGNSSTTRGHDANQDVLLELSAPAGTDPLAALEDKRRAELVSRLLDEMPAGQARVLRMLDVDETEVAQVASALGTSPNNVYVTRHRARRAMADRLLSLNLQGAWAC